MNRWYRIRHLRGAVLLILLGVLALLKEWNILRWGLVWPLFLIVFGLVMLAERIAWTADVREQLAAQNFTTEEAGRPTQSSSAGASYWTAPVPSAGIGTGPFVQPQPPAREDSGGPEDFNRPDDFNREDR